MNEDQIKQYGLRVAEKVRDEVCKAAGDAVGVEWVWVDGDLQGIVASVAVPKEQNTQQSVAKPVATVRVKGKGYCVKLSTYAAYALPEGMHDLYHAPPVPRDVLMAALSEYKNNVGLWMVQGGNAPDIAAIAAADAAQPVGQPFQQRVQPWLMECFGPMIAGDKEERNHRFLEEALELVQACGCTASEAHQLVDYVYGRPVGDKPQEVGGVMVTLAALCLAQELDMHSCGEVELARIWTKVEKIRAKQAAKPKHSPLPMEVQPASVQPKE